MTPAQLSAILAQSGTIPGAQAHTNAVRSAGVLHRPAITASDLLSTPALPVGADFVTTGSLNFGTNYKFAVAAGTKWGSTVASSVANVTTAADASATHCIDITIPQVAGADRYSVFLSTDAAPLLVAQITEAQRAAGCQVTAMGVVAAGGGAAGVCRVKVVGTGAATGASPFTLNTSWNPTAAGIVPVPAAGYSIARILAKLTVDDLRANPTLVLRVFGQIGLSPTDYVQIGSGTWVNLNSGTGLENDATRQTIDGAANLVVLVDTITGQNASANIWVELA